MVYKDMLEYERSIRYLNEKLKDKAEGYVTELKINGYDFSQTKSPKIEIVLLDPKQRLIAYRPQPCMEACEKDEQWFFGNYQKAVEDAFSWINKDDAQRESTKRFHESGDDKTPDYTLMGFF
ncbi:MAG: hypothetical protein R6U27_08695 [Desulfobacterales bacterium]